MLTSTRLDRADRALPDAESNGPDSPTKAGATSSDAGAPLNVSPTKKKLPPVWASGPALNRLLCNAMNGSALELNTSAPCENEKPEQHGRVPVVPNTASKPRLVVSKLLFVASSRGPASRMAVGAAVEGDRRATTSGPAESTVVVSNCSSGSGDALNSCAPSATKTSPKTLLAGSPVRMSLRTDDSSGPARLTAMPPRARTGCCTEVTWASLITT